jgi:hypothetical protein
LGTKGQGSCEIAAKSCSLCYLSHFHRLFLIGSLASDIASLACTSMPSEQKKIADNNAPAVPQGRHGPSSDSSSIGMAAYATRFGCSVVASVPSFLFSFPTRSGDPESRVSYGRADQHCQLVGKMSRESGTMSHCWDEENIVPYRR